MAAAILLFCFQGAGRAPKRSGDLVQRGRKNKVLLGFVHQVRAGRAPKRPGDLVQRERKNRALRGSVHQVRAGRAPKRSGDLVQRERKNKVLRGFVHQVRAGRALKRSGDLVQRERKNKGLQGFVHQVGTGRASTPGRKIGKGGPGTAQVGAPLPAKPCIFVARRQHFALERSRQPVELAPHCRQSLVPPLRGANILPWSAAGHRPSWRPITGKALCLRYEAPTFCPGALPDTGRVGASVPAKPYASVTGRQHFTLRIGRAPPMLAPVCRQSLVPPLRGANILPWSAAGHRPSWRPFAGKTLCLRYRTPTFCPGPAAGRQKTIKKRATSVARPWCAIRGSNPGHPD